MASVVLPDGATRYPTTRVASCSTTPDPTVPIMATQCRTTAAQLRRIWTDRMSHNSPATRKPETSRLITARL